MALRVLLLTLAVALLVTAAVPLPAGGQEHPHPHPTAVHRSEITMLGMPVRPGGSAGTVEEEKAYYAGRPLLKVPPCNPCRAKAMRC